MLHDAGVRSGDVVAVGCSGSFPALNLCVCAALETMRARPIIIASASASQFGANMPDFLWIDMERHLHDRHCISFRSVAASYGGYEDRALGTDAEGRELIQQAIERNGLPLIHREEFTESIDERMKIYHQRAGNRPIKAYINVGGGTVSVGRSIGKTLYQPGVNLTASPKALRVDSVMSRFLIERIPLIHLVSIPELADRFGFPIAPAATPKPGEGALFHRHGRNRWTARAVLVLIGAALIAAAYSRRRQNGMPFDSTAGNRFAGFDPYPPASLLTLLTRTLDGRLRRGRPCDRNTEVDDHSAASGSRVVLQNHPK
jgi:hypothetical protein